MRFISPSASSHKKLLGGAIDSELKFENHIKELCLNISKKLMLSALYQVHVIRETQNVDESIYKLAIKLLPLVIDASF